MKQGSPSFPDLSGAKRGRGGCQLLRYNSVLVKIKNECNNSDKTDGIEYRV